MTHFLKTTSTRGMQVVSGERGVILTDGCDGTLRAGETSNYRYVYDFADEGCYEFRIELQPRGAEWLTAMRGVYTRQ